MAIRNTIVVKLAVSWYSHLHAMMGSFFAPVDRKLHTPWSQAVHGGKKIILQSVTTVFTDSLFSGLN
jgi:hypothetical protein